MKYEMGLWDGSECHDRLQPAVEEWRSNQPFQAYQSARNLLRDPVQANAAPFSSRDWLFVSDLAAICGLHTISRVLIAAGFRHHQNDAMLGLQYAWDLAATGKFFECQETLAQLKTRLSSELHPTISAIDVYNFSSVGWRVSAERAHSEAIPTAGQDPLTWYVLSRASALRSEWRLAIDEGCRAVELSPDWARARCALSDSYLAMGQSDDANTLLRPSPNERVHCTLDFSRAVCAESRGDSESLETNLVHLTTRWPSGSRIVRFAARHFALVLLKKGDIETAEQVIKKHRLRQLESMEKNSGAQKLIPVPLIAQSFNHCVPTVAAMVAGSQDVKLNPIDLADKMMTRNGTPLFRMIDHMQSLGFQAHCVKVEPDAIEKMLTQGIPLIGMTTGLFNSHVDVICGFHSGLKLFHFRDPMHWFGFSIGYDDLKKHYQESGGLWALIAPGRTSEIQFPEDSRFVPGQAYIDLSRACVLGHRTDAEQAYRLIQDDSELAFARDRRAVCVVITPDQFQEKLDMQARPAKGAPPKTAQIRAMLSQISEITADEIFELAQSKALDLPETFVQFVESQCRIAKNEWHRAEEILVELTRRFPGFENAWSNLATVQDQLGKWDEAKSSLHCALDNAPDDESLRNRLIDLEGNNLTFDERYKKTIELIQNAPNAPEYYRDLAAVLADSPNGLDYEDAMKKCVGFFPRDPAVYGQLANWYWLQGRLDLSSRTMESGRELIGIEEMPRMFFEENDDDDIENENKPSNPPEETTGENDNETPPATESHFQRLMSKIGEKLESENRVPFSELMEMPELAELQDLDRNGELKWWESVRLVSCLVDELIGDSNLAAGSEKEHAAQLAKLLPRQSMPGIPEHYATALIQAIQNTIPRLMAAELVKWIDEQCPHREQFANLGFDRAFLLEQMELYNDSEDQLKKIIQRHPAFAPAFYRLGQISSARSDYPKAIEFYKQCLTVAPGNAGALGELIKLTRYLKDPEYVNWRKKELNLYPYSKQRLYETAFAVGDASSDQEAITLMNTAEDRFSESGLQLLIARYWTDKEQFDRALEIVKGLVPKKEDRLMADWISVDCLVARGEFDQVDSKLKEMEQREPGNEDVIDQLARSMREQDPAQAKVFAREKLIAGNIIEILCYICIQNEPQPQEVAQDIVEASKPELQESLTSSFSEALNRPEFLHSMISFQKWAAETFPQLTEPQATLAIRLNMLGDDDQAISVAQKLLDRDPDNPRWLQLMGICIQDKDARQSIVYLKREHELTGSVESLCRLARGYQLAGDHQKAKDHYHEVLKINPNETLAITNLAFKYNIQDASMFDKMKSAIELGFGPDDQYFHIIVVKTALRLGQTVPEAWLATALQRLERVKSEGGFHDEEPLLRKSILAWGAQRNNVEIVKEFGNLLSPLTTRWLWPKRKWIPQPAG